MARRDPENMEFSTRDRIAIACMKEVLEGRGVHGANRLSGNATTQLLVQGQRAGNAAATYARNAPRRPVAQSEWSRVRNALEAPLNRVDGVLPFEMKGELQELANRKVGLIRSGRSLKAVLDHVRELRRDALPRIYCRSRDRRYNKEWADAVREVESISASEAAAMHGAAGVTFVDVRDVRDLTRDGKISHAYHAPRGMLEFWIDPESPYHKPIFASQGRFIFYCALDSRAALATRLVRRMGVENATYMAGGFSAWKNAGHPVETENTGRTQPSLGNGRGILPGC